MLCHLAAMPGQGWVRLSTSQQILCSNKTQPAMVLLERGGATRPAFQVKAASGSRYEGDGLLFWEARGEATLNWNGAESICKPN
jgi:hypothetical protein